MGCYKPAFFLAFEALKVAFEHARLGVAFLLRLSFLEPTKDRHEWLIQHADHLRFVIPVNPRANFRKGERNPRTGKIYGTDNVTVAWFVWDKMFSWAEYGIQPPPFIFVHGWKI